MPLVLTDDFQNGYVTAKPVNGYQSCIQYQSGALEMWHGKYPDMGCHVIYSGQAIRSACEQFNCEQDEILDYLMAGAKIVRLDLALDVQNVPIDILQIYQDFKAGKVKTRAKQSQFTESAKAGNEKGAATTYIGSTTKRKKLLRVYDKGQQLGLDFDLTRFELETHGAIAQNAANGIMRDISRIGNTIAGMIKGYCDLSAQVPDGIFTSDNIKIALPKYQKSNTAQWLIDVVSKTLAREAATDYNMLTEFMQHFQYHYEQIKHGKAYHDET